MLNHVEVRNFQSLHHVSLALAPFTVIVGPSSCGKSAFGRAVRTVVSNARGASFISHGETTATISVTTEHGKVTLVKGKDDSYTLVPAADSPASGVDHPELSKQQRWTKLGGSVPEEVTAFLGIPATVKNQLWYTDQFDRPYLLDDTGSEVARTLGDLTHVTPVLEAAREARRLGGQSSSTLKIRAADLTADEKTAEEYLGLRDEIRALERAESLIARAGALQVRLDRIDALDEQLCDAQSAIDAFAELPAVPTPDRVTQALTAARRLQRLNDLVASIPRPITVPDAPPSAAAAMAAQARLNRLDHLGSSATESTQAMEQASELIAAATLLRDEASAAHDSIRAEAESSSYQIVSGWLSERGPFGSGPERLAEHEDTVAALAARA